MNRRQSRELAFLIVFHMDFGETGVEGLIEEALSTLNCDKEAETFGFPENVEADEFCRAIVSNVFNNAESIDGIIESNLKNWKKERINRTSLALLRICVAEIFYMDTQDSIAINEAVELSKKYSAQDDYQFVNGVLGSIAKNR